MSLTPKTVQVAIATVEIRVVRVSNKQMTQAMFKQLMGGRFIFEHEEGCIAGYPRLHKGVTVWGWVAYCPKDGSCSSYRWDMEIHTHIIYERKGHLYQTSIGRRIGEACESECQERWAKLRESIFSPKNQLFIAI